MACDRDRPSRTSSTRFYRISANIKKFDCSQYVRREAHAIIDVTIVEISTNRQLYGQTYTSDELEGSLITLKAGVFGSVDELRALAEKALTEVVDKALDDTALQEAMRPVPLPAAAMPLEECVAKCRS